MTSSSEWHSACGKVILFGEHAVVYGAKAIAASIPDAIQAQVRPGAQGQKIAIPAWDLEVAPVETPTENLLVRVLSLIHRELDLGSQSYSLNIRANIPAASGLGASAALAVASIRALSSHYKRALNDAQVNALAYKCEELAHGHPSGLDNTLATYGGLLEFQRNDDQVHFEAVTGVQPFSLLVALSGKKGFTAQTVARVKRQRDQDRLGVDSLFESVDRARVLGTLAMQAYDLAELGRNFDANQKCLRALGVSCPEIEQIITIARENGALGAKLTGSGDGGAVLVLAGASRDPVQSRLKEAGYESLVVNVASADSGYPRGIESAGDGAINKLR